MLLFKIECVQRCMSRGALKALRRGDNDEDDDDKDGDEDEDDDDKEMFNGV